MIYDAESYEKYFKVKCFGIFFSTGFKEIGNCYYYLNNFNVAI